MNVFSNSRYITIGIKQTISPLHYLLLWELIDEMNVEQKDYLQAFNINAKVGKRILVEIEYIQETPEYRSIHKFYTDIPIEETMNAVSKKEPPPEGVGYVPPKKGARVAKTPDGNNKGWLDNDGNIWVPVPRGHPLAHGGEHWNVNYPNGGYDNVYPPEGHVRKGSGGRGKFSPSGKRIVMDTTAVGGTAILFYGAYRVVRMAPSLVPPLWWTIPANLACP